MRHPSAAIVIVLAAGIGAPAAAAELVCSGTEPFWRLEADGGSGTLTRPGPERVVETRLTGALERLGYLDPPWLVWRGRPAGGDEPLVAVVRREACSDAMSGARFDHRAVVSFPESPAATGCCTVAAASPPPAGRWTVRALFGAEAGPPPESTLAIAADGAVTGRTGCNQAGGTAEIDGDRIAFGPMVATRMACAPPAMARERRYLDALAAARRWRLDDGRLVLLDGSGAAVLAATRD